MADLFDNPMGLCGFDFVEFTAPRRAFWNGFREHRDDPRRPAPVEGCGPLATG